jgi:hypothetical protein
MCNVDRAKRVCFTIPPADILGNNPANPLSNKARTRQKEISTHMATQAQIEANRRNAEKSTGPQSAEGKAKSSRNRLSHGFNSTVVLMENENKTEFNLLYTDLANHFQPLGPDEEILLEKMVNGQWQSLRACRLQILALNASPTDSGYMPKDLGLLIRYQQSADRNYYKARTELLKAQKERPNCEIGFEPQTPAADPIADPIAGPHEPLVEPQTEPPEPIDTTDMDEADFLESQLHIFTDPADREIAKRKIAEMRNRRKAA